jgi:hypothetical protein
MPGGKAGICSRSRTDECQREAAMAKAAAALTNPSALIALRVFDTFFSQWRVGMSPIGLDYPGIVDLAGRILKIEVDAEILLYLRVLEAEQLEAWKPAEAGG